MKSIYLDYAAATPMDEAALAAMQPYLSDNFYNPSAAYEAARHVRRDLESARAKVADVLGSKDQEIIFTAGGTEANNLAIHGILQAYPESHSVTSAIEHESVLEPLKKYNHTVVSVKSSGLVDPQAVIKAINNQTVLVSIMYANNEIGTIQPIKDIAAAIVTIRQARQKSGNVLPIWLHTDAAQAANYLDLHVSRLNVDLMTLNGGKIYAAKQSGCLYVRSTVKLLPQLDGGGQERSLRNGTENVAAIQAFATMLQKVQSDRQQESQRLKQMRDTFIATISQNKISIQMNGTMDHRLPNNLNLQFESVDGERLLMELDEAGLMIATGSACSASSDEPSHVLLALGLTPAAASGSVRITFGRPTTEAQAVQAATILSQQLRTHSARLV